MLRIVGLVLALALCTGQPQVAGAVECRNVAHEVARLIVCDANPRHEALRLYLKDASGQMLGSFDALRAFVKTEDGQLVFAMNAGMYHKGGRPVGLLIQRGIEKTPLNLSDGFGNFFRKPNGVFLITQEGVADVVESSQVAGLGKRIVEATQSGPLLVLRGSINEALPKSLDKHTRNGVGIDSRGHAIFAISENELTLREFARVFRDALGCSRALYLDGSVSSLRDPRGKERGRSKGLGPMFAVTTAR